MNSPLQFQLNKAIYVFHSLDELEEFALSHFHIAKELSDAIDKELDSDKRATFSQSLAEVTELIFKAGDLIEEVEAKLCPSGTESDGGEL